jgi:hypothetical protein
LRYHQRELFTQKIGYVQAEYKFALEVLDEFPETGIYIIPIRLDNCEIHYEKLKDIQYVDMFPNWKEGLEKILQSMEIKSDHSLGKKSLFGREQTGEKISDKYETNIPHTDFDYYSISEKTKHHEKFKDIDDNDKKEIKNLITTYKRDPQFQEDILKKFNQLSMNKKLYQSHDFMQFLRLIRRNEDKHTILTFFSILLNLIKISKIEDKQFYLKILANYKCLLNDTFCNWNERYTYSYGVVTDILQSLDLSDEEWCELHWKRIKHAIVAGIEDISKINDNISFLRSHCKPLFKYHKYLGRADGRIETKNKIRSLLISG